MRKLSAWVLCMALGLCFVGCANNTSDSRSVPKESVTSMTAEKNLSEGNDTYAASDSEGEYTNEMNEPRDPGYNAFSGYLRGAGKVEKGYDGEAFINSEAVDEVGRFTGISTRNSEIRQHRTTTGLRLCTSSACIFSVIIHKVSLTCVSKPASTLCIPMKNLTAHLTHNGYAVLP
ncbi:MAG: hypothetical protein IJ555_06800 [Ruminococcus sp.]|nr:hypothetical protein [Ruminococcus sp.]MBR1749405.1 hypothetical protein [Ruminococcus sp.]MBR1751620.1 hypothetical protein [Ruminococcus sp.]